MAVSARVESQAASLLSGLETNCTAVFDSAVGNSFRKFPGKDDPRTDDLILKPAIQPGFKIPVGSTVFTIGSCFARNVEERLVSHGMNVPGARFAMPVGETGGRRNQVLNQYNPGTILQMLEFVETGFPEAGIYDDREGLVLDGLLSTGGAAVTPERAAERRRQILELYRDGLEKAECVILTLGLVETWIDLPAGIFLNQTPGMRLLRRTPERFRFERLDYARCTHLVRGILDRLVAANRNRNIVLTVSPVPFGATMKPRDAVIENAYSKALLRVVSEEVLGDYPMVDYFPSFEMVSSGGLASFKEDNIHVEGGIVDQVVTHMINHYVES